MRTTGQVVVLDTADLGVQPDPGHQAPGWPHGGSQQVHLDLYVEDITTAHAEVTAAGARLLKAVDDAEEHEGRVYADPAGHPFCLCWGPPPLGGRAAAPMGRG